MDKRKKTKNIGIDEKGKIAGTNPDVICSKLSETTTFNPIETLKKLFDDDPEKAREITKTILNNYNN